MRPPSSRSPMLCAAVAAVLLAGCGDDPPEEREPPAGVISDAFARTVPLNITRKEFLRRARVEPVRVVTEDAPPTKVDVDEIDARQRSRLERRWGKARGGVVRIPARRFECLVYRGQQPERYSRKFCFGRTNRFEFAVTGNPL